MTTTHAARPSSGRWFAQRLAAVCAAVVAVGLCGVAPAEAAEGPRYRITYEGTGVYDRHFPPFAVPPFGESTQTDHADISWKFVFPDMELDNPDRTGEDDQPVSRGTAAEVIGGSYSATYSDTNSSTDCSGSGLLFSPAFGPLTGADWGVDYDLLFTVMGIRDDAGATDDCTTTHTDGTEEIERRDYVIPFRAINQASPTEPESALGAYVSLPKEALRQGKVIQLVSGRRGDTDSCDGNIGNENDAPPCTHELTWNGTVTLEPVSGDAGPVVRPIVQTPSVTPGPTAPKKSRAQVAQDKLVDEMVRELIRRRIRNHELAIKMRTERFIRESNRDVGKSTTILAFKRSVARMYAGGPRARAQSVGARARRVLLGKSRLKVSRDGRFLTARIKLSRRVLRRLKRRGSLRAVMELSYVDAGIKRTAKARFKLRPEKRGRSKR